MDLQRELSAACTSSQESAINDTVHVSANKAMYVVRPTLWPCWLLLMSLDSVKAGGGGLFSILTKVGTRTQKSSVSKTCKDKDLLRTVRTESCRCYPLSGRFVHPEHCPKTVISTRVVKQLDTSMQEAM